tara:strand:+ start:1826 stop:1957 length:132 start_codon:yes stop_codon:yes gene_type:complete
MLSLPALFGVMMAPGLVLLMASFIVGLFEQDEPFTTDLMSKDL